MTTLAESASAGAVIAIKDLALEFPTYRGVIPALAGVSSRRTAGRAQTAASSRRGGMGWLLASFKQGSDAPVRWDRRLAGRCLERRDAVPTGKQTTATGT